MDLSILLLPTIFAGLGYLFSMPSYIKFLNRQTPLRGLLIYYFIIFTVIIVLEHIGLIINGTRFDSFRQGLGTILIIFSFFILVDWESCYINQILHNGEECNYSQFNTVYLQSEDGAVYSLASMLTKNVQYRRLLTYVLAPFLLTLIGLLIIINPKITIGLF
jgi:hypothetical protein